MSDVRCKHCGENIVLVENTIFNPYWTHQPAGAAFMDGMYQACRLVCAAPPDNYEGNQGAENAAQDGGPS
jgi:hypothetical protein